MQLITISQIILANLSQPGKCWKQPILFWFFIKSCTKAPAPLIPSSARASLAMITLVYWWLGMVTCSLHLQACQVWWSFPRSSRGEKLLGFNLSEKKLSMLLGEGMRGDLLSGLVRRSACAQDSGLSSGRFPWGVCFSWSHYREPVLTSLLF